ncbi:hypothetical protein H2200_002811 [Cladophialophora chaetospira]|uniref:CENP-V/GFA domain-containing protein n=1 Tax=Cladophialophora chaetospira TaxID=386627 RepID=A0AA38XG64_9EURO|nr:hypothetical protein H2200_002811 [Cladophialophora chaetospira]
MSMSGSCLCGNVKIEVTGEPEFKTICHCLDDRKISNSAFSYACNFPKSQFSITASSDTSLKTYTKTSDHGTQISSHFCSNCGVTLWRSGGTMGADIVNVKAGVLDDPQWLSESGKPVLEVYVDRRLQWVPKLEGVLQLNSKYEIIEGVPDPEFVERRR